MKQYPVIFWGLLSITLLTIGFLLYPGSSYYNHAATSYNLIYNTISESGATQNYRHESTIYSRIFFSLGLFSSALTTYYYFLKRALGFGLVISTLLFLIPFFPTDTNHAIHINLFFGVVVSLLTAFIYLSIKKRRPIFYVSTILFLTYTVFIILHPSTVENETIRTIHVIAQKVVLTYLFISMMTQDFFATKVLVPNSKRPRIHRHL